MTTNPGPPIIPGYAPPPPPTEPFPVADPPPAARGRSSAMVPLVIVLAVLLVAAGGVAAWALTRGPAGAATPAATASAAAKFLNLSGTLTLDDFNASWRVEGEPCAGTGGYQDIHTGAQVIVTDSAGKTVGVSTLSSGRIVTVHTSCRFDFGVGVPPGLGFYGVAIGNRKPYQVSEAEAASALALTLG